MLGLTPQTRDLARFVGESEERWTLAKPSVLWRRKTKRTAAPLDGRSFAHFMGEESGLDADQTLAHLATIACPLRGRERRALATCKAKRPVALQGEEALPPPVHVGGICRTSSNSKCVLHLAPACA